MHRTCFPSYGVHFPADIVFIISRIKTYTRNTKQRDRVTRIRDTCIYTYVPHYTCAIITRTYRNSPNTRMLGVHARIIVPEQNGVSQGKRIRGGWL